MQEANMTNTAIRNADLWRMLCECRRELQDDVQSRIRDGRTGRSIGARDGFEDMDGDIIQGDVELAVLQMKADTLTRLDEALVRLEAGKYGSCVECEGEISERRLRALPFAVRCQACEEGHTRHRGERRGSRSLVSHVVTYWGRLMRLRSPVKDDEGGSSAAPSLLE
jgi:DnaK suppressor protein